MADANAFGDTRRWSGLATVAAYPIGDPGEASVRIVDRQGFGSAEELYAHAFGADADRTNLHGGVVARWSPAFSAMSLTRSCCMAPQHHRSA